MKIPDHLSHLRTDRRGLPVPFVNRWGGEDVSRLRIAPDRHAGGRPAVFLDDADEPVPDFTAQNMGRQRQSMAAGLCQVCARHVPWSRRFLAIAGLSVERITVNGRTCAAVTEPWLCERCATFATNHCPALIRRRRDEELTLYPITSQRQVQLVASAGWIEGPLEAESRRIQPAMWVKAIVTGIHLAPTTWGTAMSTTLSETAFQSRITDLCDWYGLRWHHETDSRRSRAGFPDLVIVGNTVIFAELKTATGRISPDQQEWADALTNAGAEHHTWRPADWPVIQARLQELRR